MILNWYYKIWVDAIVFEKTKFGHMRNWKTYTIIPMSIIQGVNIATLFFLLVTIGVKIDFFVDFDLFPGNMIDGFLSGALTLFLPPMALNYFLIFRKGKYKELTQKYKYRKGKLYKTYFFSSILIFILPIVIGMIIIRL